jgi:hypothetical protein
MRNAISALDPVIFDELKKQLRELLPEILQTRQDITRKRTSRRSSESTKFCMNRPMWLKKKEWEEV